MYYISAVCLTGSGTISLHAERLQISDTSRKQNESNRRYAQRLTQGHMGDGGSR